MTRDNIVKLLKILKAKNIDNDKSEWVMCSCLFAKYKHKKGTDSNPSGGIKIGNGSYYHCFGCGTSGDITSILFDLLYLHKTHGIPAPEIAQAFSFLEDEDVFTFEPLEYTEADTENLNTFVEFPSGWAEQHSSVFNSKLASAYLTDRKVPQQIWTDFNLRYDNVKQMIIFPYKNANGKVAGGRGRSVNPNCDKKYRHYDYSYTDPVTGKSKNNTSLVWYRESQLSLDDPKPLIVVEGQFDAARIYQQYRNVTAILTALVSEKKLEKLLMMCTEVLWMSDNDDAGIASRENAREFFTKKNFPYRDIYLPEDYKDPDMVPPNFLKYLLNDYVELDPLIV